MRSSFLSLISFLLVPCLGFSCCSELSGCSTPSTSCADYVPGAGEQFGVTLAVHDEADKPVAAAVVELPSGSGGTTSPGGVVQLSALPGPVLAIVSAPGYLAEPVPIGWADAGRSVPVRLLSRLGGRRVAVHSVGDVMFGRRFETPNPGEETLIPPDTAATAAAQVVEAVRRVMAIADVRTINLETVISDRTQGSYPGKPFILRSRPATLAGLQALGVNAVGLANNHSRDFMEDGIAETQAALQKAGLPYTGAALAPSDAVTAVQTTVGSTRVAMLAFTTVDGSVTNDDYPLDGAKPPSPLPPQQAFAYQLRPWSYQSATWMVPSAQRRIGSAWQLYKRAESGLSASLQSPAWASLRRVYPELQDWVARRGHGGAIQWQADSSPQLVQAAAQRAEVVVVQLHGGYEFQEVPSANLQAAAHGAIDAGADLVVCHHPHVLQGLEWYRGKLIAYSLGNFIFDQDFLQTFDSAILRTVWDGKTLLQARLLPVELVSYRPTPVTDAAADQILLRMWERSQLRAIADRDPATGVRAYVREPDTQAQPAHLQLEHHTARVLATAPAPQSLTLRVPAGQTVALPFKGLVPSRLGLDAASTAAIYVGRDLFGWGRFEEETANSLTRGRTHWNLDGQCDKDVVVGEAAQGRGFMRLRRDQKNLQRLLLRPIARVPISRHRLYPPPATSLEPLDPDPSYSVRLQARLAGSAHASLRVDLYHFDSADPDESPTSDLVGSVEYPLTLASDSTWHTVELPIAPQVLGGPSSQANMVLLYLQLDPPAEGTTLLDVDELMFIEWRRASQMPDRPGVYAFVHSAETTDRMLQLTGLPAQ